MKQGRGGSQPDPVMLQMCTGCTASSLGSICLTIERRALALALPVQRSQIWISSDQVQGAIDDKITAIITRIWQFSRRMLPGPAKHDRQPIVAGCTAVYSCMQICLQSSMLIPTLDLLQAAAMHGPQGLNSLD